MRLTFARTGGRAGRRFRPIGVPKVALLIVAIGTIANAASIPIFTDDFEAYPPESNPDVPPVGEPWVITEVDPQGIGVDDNQRLMFGRYRNTAVAPFSAAARQLLRQNGNLSVSFDYLGYRGSDGLAQYFDVAGYDPLSGDPAFFLRFNPQSNPGGKGLHDVLYLDPSGSLLDSNVDIGVDGGTVQSVSIFADFAAETFELDIEGNLATLPMFIAPDEIVGVEFANYGVAGGSGSLDNLQVTVSDGEGSPIPEVATIWMTIAGLLSLVGVWAARRHVE